MVTGAPVQHYFCPIDQRTEIIQFQLNRKTQENIIRLIREDVVQEEWKRGPLANWTLNLKILFSKIEWKQNPMI